MTGLRRWNVLLAVAHAAQGVAILVLANDATIPITRSYIDGPPASGSQTTDVLYDLPSALRLPPSSSSPPSTTD